MISAATALVIAMLSSVSAALPATIDLLTLGAAGVTIFGAEILDAGWDASTAGSISNAGDVNADGYDDLIIGKERADAANNLKIQAGESIVIFGGPSLPSTIALAVSGSADITTLVQARLTFKAHQSARLEMSMVTALPIFSPVHFWPTQLRTYGAMRVKAICFYGGNGFTSSATHLGTSAAETLTGTLDANVMVGGRGNDILLGTGGADVLNGGEGDDTLAVSTLPFQRVTGGNGDDTLRLDGSGLTLDLTTLADNRIQGIELIDITGAGINTLILNYREVLTSPTNRIS